MKALLGYLFLCVAVCGMVGCGDGGGGENVNGKLTLAVDKNSITSGEEKAKFSVMLDDVDVTAESSIQSEETGQELEKGEFIPDLSGNYTFFAEYKGKISNKETVQVALPFERLFLKNALLQEITSTSCPNCPANHDYINVLKELEPARMIMLAYHDTFKAEEHTDPYATPSITAEMLKLLGTGGYGPAKVDYNMVVGMGVTKEMIGEYLALRGICGIALKTTLDGQKLSVEVKVQSKKFISSSCVLGVVITESGLKALQIVGSREDPNYIHNDVVRDVLTNGTALGDKVEMGAITPGKEYAKSYTYTIPTSYKKDNMNVVVYLIDTDKKSSLNCQSVKVGQSIDYQTVEYVEGDHNNPFIEE